MSKRPVWDWNDAVAAADVPSLTKLVCYNIARYLSSAGKGWRVSIADMRRDTGMKERALTIHLAKAAKAGLIIIKREYNHLGHRTTTQYIPRFPDGSELPKEGAELPAPNADRPSSPDAPNADSLPAPDAARLPAPDAAQVSSQRGNLSKDNPPTPREGGGADSSYFDEFWSAFPKGKRSHTNKHKARIAFEAVASGKHREGHEATPGTIIEGAYRYAASKPDPDFIPMAVTWLNGARWQDDPAPPAPPPEKRAASPPRQYGWAKGGEPRDTSEPIDKYIARMIAEGKYKPSGASA